MEPQSKTKTGCCPGSFFISAPGTKIPLLVNRRVTHDPVLMLAISWVQAVLDSSSRAMDQHQLAISFFRCFRTSVVVHRLFVLKTGITFEAYWLPS
jgi:hypothetical protein